MEFNNTPIEPPRNLIGVWVYLDKDGTWQITPGVVSQIMAYNKANLLSGEPPISYAPVFFTDNLQAAEGLVEEYKELIEALNGNNDNGNPDPNGHEQVRPEPTTESDQAGYPEPVS